MKKIAEISSASVALVAAVAAASVWVAPEANAYTRTGYRWHSTSMAWGTPSSATYTSSSDQAAIAWNNTSAPITVYKVIGSPSGGVETIVANLGSNGQDGYSHWTCSTDISTSGYARYNTYYTDGYSATGKKQVMVHEFGHLLGLGHAGGSSCSWQPIMYYTSDRYFTCGHSTPQADDVSGMIAIY